MRILVIGVGPWNDIQSGNNIMTNWFTGYDAEFANIYVHSGSPCNKLCESYLLVSDEMMLKSFLGRKAGVERKIKFSEQLRFQEKEGLYLNKTGIERKAKELPRNIAFVIKDLVWLLGRIDKVLIESYIERFNPDIIFCHHVFGMNFWRIEKYVSSITNVPMVAFTGDSEVSLRKFSLSPLFWIRQITLRCLFRNHVKRFSHYFTFSEEQAKMYQLKYGIHASTLYKCVDSPSVFYAKPVGCPIRLVYAGNIIYNRWRTIGAIADALDEINKDGCKVLLDIYTNTALTNKMSHRLSNKQWLTTHGRVAPNELDNIYKKSDIALHIESFDLKNRLDTKDSFSTKIVDLMNSTCAIMAICWEKHNGFQYLKREDAAICVSDVHLIEQVLRNLTTDTSIIQEYALKAWACGLRNHSRVRIHNQITEAFDDAIKEFKFRK